MKLKSPTMFADNDQIKRWRSYSGEKKLAMMIIAETLLSVTSRSDSVRTAAIESVNSEIFRFWCLLADIDISSVEYAIKDPVRRAGMRRSLEEFLEEML